MIRVHSCIFTTRHFFFKGQSIRDSTGGFRENKGHEKMAVLRMQKIRDSDNFRLRYKRKILLSGAKRRRKIFP